MASETTMCARCGHDHRTKWPENYPYPDRVCPMAPESCDCFSFTRFVVPPKPKEPERVCRRCGRVDGPNVGFHQAECMSEWVERPAATPKGGAK